jgi:HSF-type DNA-binding
MVVRHDYHDLSLPGSLEKLLSPNDIKKIERKNCKLRSSRGNNGTRSAAGKRNPFPQALHQMLDDSIKCGYEDIITWQAHGRSFRVLDSKRFVAEVLPKYFKQTKWQSYLRQLALYGFLRITRKGDDCGSYYHERFLRGQPLLANTIARTAVKGTGVPYIPSPETEPDFTTMAPVGCNH